MKLDPTYAVALFNLLLIVVMGIIAWLVKRAVSANDITLTNAIRKIEEMSKVIGELRVMMAGELLPRTEHVERTKQVDQQLLLLRESHHELRGTVQALTSKVAILDTLINRKEQKS